MKKTIFLLSLISLIFLISLSAYSFARQTVRKLASPIPSAPVIPTEILPTKVPVNEFKFDNKTYQFYFHKMMSGETLELIPNFENATFSAQIVKNNNCSFGINGGFYTKSGEPLGLFQIGTKKIGSQIQNATFNGFLSFASGLSISSAPFYPSSTPYPASFFTLQSGPLIFLKNTVQPNFLEEDYSRRSLIAKTMTQDFYLFSIFEKDNVFNGPRLKDLRDIFLLKEFTQIASFELVLNLDGGSASAFYDKNVQIEEFKPIGSFLCGK